MYEPYLRHIALALACWAGTCCAQTAWPPYMSSLVPGPSESSATAALPPDVAVQAPAANLSPDRARWSGRWQGWACFGRQCDIRIAVEQVSETRATVVYAGASTSQAQVTDRVEGDFTDGELRLRLHTGTKLVLRMRATGDLEMSLWKPDTQLISAGVLTQGPMPYTRRLERVPTPWVDQGKAQTLEMVVYQPRGTGPFPTLVFNHGSTGRGDRPAWFTQTWTSPEIAAYFVDRGWQVLFPQRRGRGGSDGLYDEGFETDRSRYSCEPRLAMPGLERAVADLDVVMAHVHARADVDPQRLLLGGVSRGGILAVAYAGTHPGLFRGVVNFVGGWVGDQCPQAERINPVLFQRGAAFDKPMLWLYGDKDTFYTLRHSRQNFDGFIAAGGRGSFQTFEPALGQDGHSIYASPPLWRAAMDTYLQQAGLP